MPNFSLFFLSLARAEATIAEKAMQFFEAMSLAEDEKAAIRRTVAERDATIAKLRQQLDEAQRPAVDPSGTKTTNDAHANRSSEASTPTKKRVAKEMKS